MTASDEARDEYARRAAGYRRNERLEALLEELNAALALGEAPLLDRVQAPRWPVVFVVGVPRSGTTVVLQCLARSGLVAWPSNLLARFYRAPYLGARIQQMLTDPVYRFRDEFAELEAGTGGLRSDLGKTRGLLAPNEFWYFWRRFFPEPAEDWARAERRGLEPAARFAAELALLERAFGRPFALKAMIANWNIPYLDRLLPRAVFVHVRRDPRFNAQSLIEARERFYGDRHAWYSFRPPEYPWLRRLDPLEQVAGQVLLTRRAVDAALAALPPERRLAIDYEAFCSRPQRLIEALCERFHRQGFDASPPTPDGASPQAIRCADHWRLAAADRRRLEAALERFSDPAQTAARWGVAS